MNIDVHIEHLILDGLPVKGSDGSIIQAAVETELSRLLGEQGLAGMSAGAVTNLSAGPIELPRETRPANLGHQIAQAIQTCFETAPATRRSPIFRGGQNR
jgi:hypothetical protein